MGSAQPGDGAGSVVSGRGLVVRRRGHLVLDDLTFGLASGKVTVRRDEGSQPCSTV